MHLTRTLARWFPVPNLLAPHAHGVDITDASVKWLSLARSGTRTHVASYGNQPLPPGVVETGAVRDTKTLVEALRDIKKHAHIVRAHAALPEEAAFVFSMHVHPDSTRDEIMHM